MRLALVTGAIGLLVLSCVLILFLLSRATSLKTKITIADNNISAGRGRSFVSYAQNIKKRGKR